MEEEIFLSFADYPISIKKPSSTLG